MNKLHLLILILFLSTCTSQSRLEEGRWTGTLSPMNHPEIDNPVAYEVSYSDDELSVSVLGPGGETITTQNPVFEGDTLFFSFNEPEEQVLLNCALARTNGMSFEGRCSDTEGKWARFTMEPPQ